MKSNEEYLDELLKTMHEEEAGGTEDTQMQEDISNELQESEMELEVDAGFMDELLQAENLVDFDMGVPEERNSSLEQLMAQMQDTPEEVPEDEPFATEESIEALLDAAKASGAESSSENLEDAIEFDMSNQDEIAEIEALLGGMSEDIPVTDENNALLNALEGTDEPFFDEEEEREVDIAELDSILEQDLENAAINQQKEKKESKLKIAFQKLFSMLMEEVPEEEVPLEEKAMRLSDENRDILDQLNREEEKKMKKKEKKEQKEKSKEEKKKAKEEKKKAKEQKKKEKQAKQPKKEKKPKKVKEPEIPEKKLPKKKVRIAFLFAFTVLVAILLLEFLIPPMLTVSTARKAYDRGDYFEAYKEYYGQKLSEEDEKKFQAATVIMRMQSNLDGYNGYMNAGNEVNAIHSLLEAVHIKLDAFAQAEQYGVTEQVEIIYQEILNILSTDYQLTEEAAYELIQEKSDVTYTKKLQALADGTNSYVEESEEAVSQEDLLPEEEELFQ